MFRSDSTTGSGSYAYATLLLSFAAGLALTVAPASAQELEEFGISIPLSMSYDGSVVVGLNLEPSGWTLYRWSEEGGLELILSGDAGDNDGARVSGDGEVVSGDIQNDENIWGVGVRWKNGALTYLEDLNFAGPLSYDGTVVAGGKRNDDGNYEAAISGGENFGLGLAYDVDSTGTVVVGSGISNNQSRAMIWPAGIDLGAGVARAVSPDGTIVVGRLTSGGSNEAFLWKQGQGLQQLGPGVALDVSRDGATVIGSNAGAGFVWTEAGGLQPLAPFLQEGGVDPAGWQSLSASLISQDGRVLVGSGFNPEGQHRSWRAVLTGCFVVTRDSDQPDADPGDGFCDVDVDEEGDQCTLRAAIQEANALDGRQCIHFDVRDTGGNPVSGLPVIRPGSLLPTITDSLTIDGTTQSHGFVEIDGASGGAGSGLTVEADSFHVRGLLINHFDEYGMRLTGGAGHVIRQNRIGFDEEGEVLRLNALGGVLVEGGARRVVIGGEEEGDDENFIGGGVIVQGEDTREVSVLRNVLEVKDEWLSEQVIGVPIDLDGDGPTCAPWAEQSAAAPNNHVPAPRITRLEAGTIEGLTRANATVVAFKVTKRGSDRGRYFARRVEPVGTATANGQGRFTMSADVAAGDTVAVAATDEDGNTSELSQLVRPVVFLPGIGGTALKGADGSALWLPLGFTSDARNDRLHRLRMSESGTSIENVAAGDVLELFGYKVYGPIHRHLEEAGYEGDPTNQNPHTLDLWRFPNDWRRSTHDLAGELRALVDRLTNLQDENVAASCQVDLMAHSNGGLIGSVYLRQNDDSADRVHRFLTIGTPYLGTPQAAAAHTRGYVFQVEETPVGFGWDVDWGRMIEMTRNVPGAWGLMPSSNYWQANGGNPYLVDFTGVTLDDEAATRAFLTAPKVSESGDPLGLARNAAIWQGQQTNVHDRIDDWRTWDRPPHIFRFVGDEAASTATNWWLDAGPTRLAPGTTRRSEAGDTDVHRAYRERLRPGVGRGDETVSLVSATLGRLPEGDADFSGVDQSSWIEEFESFPCTHSGLIETACEGATGRAVDRALRVVRSGYAVPAPEMVPASGRLIHADGAATAHARDLFQITSTAAVDVWVEDSDGRTTGPSPEADGSMLYAVPRIGYWHGLHGATVSLPPDDTYSITIRTRHDGAVRFVRSVVDAAGTATHLLFSEQGLSARGRVHFVLQAGSADPDAVLEVDADGDGAYESAVPPGASLGGGTERSPLPMPRPSHVTARSDGVSSASVNVSLVTSSDEGWQWTASTDDPWIDVVSGAGAASADEPGVLALTLRPGGAQNVWRRGEVALAFSYGDLLVETVLPIELMVGDVSLSAPTMLQPEEGATELVLPVALSWAPVDNADRYDVQIAHDAHLGDVVRDVAVSEPTYDAVGLQPLRTYYWRVRAVGSVYGPWSGTRSFTMAQVVSVTQEELPGTYALEQNYPNPFNPSTEIVFSLPEGGHARLTLYDVLGRRLAVLHDGATAAGTHRLRIEAGDLPSGVYMYRLEAGAFTETRRMTVVR